jgi:hypothetical protein
MCLMPETWVNYQRRRVENASLMTNLRRRIFYASSLRGVKGDMFLPTRVSNDSPQRRHLLSTRVSFDELKKKAPLHIYIYIYIYIVAIFYTLGME